MITIMNMVESCNVSMVTGSSDLGNLLTQFSLISQNENVICTIVSKVKAIFRKIITILTKIKDKIKSIAGIQSLTDRDLRIIKAKLDGNTFYINSFKRRAPEACEWNNRYLNAMPDMVKKLDSIRMRLPDGSMVDSAADTIVDAIIDRVNRANIQITNQFITSFP